MKEKEIILQLKRLREIKPDKKWVFLTKKEILGQKGIEIFLIFKPVYAGLFLIFLLIGIFGVSKNSLPGEPLYYIKKISEETEKVFIPEEEKPKLNLELANKRLEELKKVAEKNEVRKLVPAIKEVQANISQTKENLVKSGKVDEEILKKTLTLASKVEEVESVLGTKIANEDLKEIVKYLISDFEKRSLTENQKERLEKAKEYFENEDYQRSLEELLTLSYSQ